MKTLNPTTGDYYQLRYYARTMELANAQVELSQIEADSAARAYRAFAERLGLDPSKPYRFDDQHYTLTEIEDGASNRGGNG